VAGSLLVLLGVSRILHQPHQAAAWILGALQSATGLILLIGFSVYIRKPSIKPRYDWRGRDRSKLDRDLRKAQQDDDTQTPAQTERRSRPRKR
jgi:hypothetical protein